MQTLSKDGVEDVNRKGDYSQTGDNPDTAPGSDPDTTASTDKKRRFKCGMFPVCLVSSTFKIYVQLKLSGGHHQGEDI